MWSTSILVFVETGCEWLAVDCCRLKKCRKQSCCRWGAICKSCLYKGLYLTGWWDNFAEAGVFRAAVPSGGVLRCMIGELLVVFNPCRVHWPPSCRDIFCLKKFDTFTRTPIRVSKMNAVARVQLAFQMLTLLQIYLFRQSQYSKTLDSKYLALITPTGGVFVWIRRLGARVSLRSRHLRS